MKILNHLIYDKNLLRLFHKQFQLNLNWIRLLNKLNNFNRN
jgi:hypothetical protein